MILHTWFFPNNDFAHSIYLANILRQEVETQHLCMATSPPLTVIAWRHFTQYFCTATRVTQKITCKYEEIMVNFPHKFLKLVNFSMMPLCRSENVYFGVGGRCTGTLWQLNLSHRLNVKIELSACCSYVETDTRIIIMHIYVAKQC